MALEDLKALLEVEAGIPPTEQGLYFNGVEMVDAKKTMEQYGVQDDDMLLMQRKAASSSTSSSAATSGTHPNFDLMRQHVLNDPRLLEQLSSLNPELVRAAREDPSRFTTMVQQLEQSRRQAEDQRTQMMAANADPFDVEAQKRIEDAIKQENIAANLEAAMEYNPESFARVTRLYIDVEINGTKLVALVDSGAQSTVISPETAERCDLMRLVDTRFAGVAKGVGTANIIGRVHSAQMKLSKDFFLGCSFIVVEGKGSELLLGLDMLQRHRACIDLRKHALVFDDCEIPFLAEHELPEKQRKMEVHGSADDEMPSEARFAGPQAAENAESSLSNVPSSTTTTTTPQIIPEATATNPAQTTTSQSAAPTTAGGGGGGSTGTNQQYPEEHIATLTNLGMSRQEALNALEMTGGNLDLAASLLF
ncbi:unnamed protein product [Absidia cylindrospora]